MLQHNSTKSNGHDHNQQPQALLYGPGSGYIGRYFKGAAASTKFVWIRAARLLCLTRECRRTAIIRCCRKEGRLSLCYRRFWGWRGGWMNPRCFHSQSAACCSWRGRGRGCFDRYRCRTWGLTWPGNRGHRCHCHCSLLARRTWRLWLISIIVEWYPRAYKGWSSTDEEMPDHW